MASGPDLQIGSAVAQGNTKAQKQKQGGQTPGKGCAMMAISDIPCPAVPQHCRAAVSVGAGKCWQARTGVHPERGRLGGGGGGVPLVFGRVAPAWQVA